MHGAAAKLDVVAPLTENEIRTGNDTRDRKRIGEAESMSRTAIITGASRGIGAAVAERLSKDGFSVVVNYSGSEAEAFALVNKITSAGGHAISAKTDVSKADEGSRLFAGAGKEFGGVDVLVNNSRIMLLSSIARTDEPGFDREIPGHLKSTFN